MWVLNLSVVSEGGRAWTQHLVTPHHVSQCLQHPGHSTLLTPYLKSDLALQQPQPGPGQLTAQFLILMSEIIASNSIKCKHYQPSLITRSSEYSEL